MITEDRLRSLLEDTADAFEPPVNGVDQVVAALQPAAPARRRLPRPTLPRLALVGTAAVLVVAVGLAWRDRSPGVTSATDLAEQSGKTLSNQLARGESATAAADAGRASVAGARLPDPTKVIKTGGIEIEVADGRFADAVATITRLAVGAGGYIADSKTSEIGNHPSGTITVRVPADQYEALNTQLRSLGKVRNANSAGRDVTAEYTDVQARLRTLTATRTSLLEVLSKARAIGDILAVQDRLNAVQTDIETLQGRQQVLDNQVGLATISITVHGPGAATLTTTPHRSAWQRAVDGFTGTWSSLLAHSGTALAVVLAAGAALAGLVALGRWGRRAYARHAA